LDRDLEDEPLGESSQIETESTKTPERPKPIEPTKAKSAAEADKPVEQPPVKKRRGRPPKNKPKDPSDATTRKTVDEPKGKAKASRMTLDEAPNDKSWENFESENTLKDDLKHKKSSEASGKKTRRLVAAKGTAEPVEQTESTESVETLPQRTRSKTRASHDTKTDKQPSNTDQQNGRLNNTSYV